MPNGRGPTHAIYILVGSAEAVLLVVIVAHQSANLGHTRPSQLDVTAAPQNLDTNSVVPVTEYCMAVGLRAMVWSTI